MPTITPINVGGIGQPTQVTVTTPGTYTVLISALASDPAVTFDGPGQYTLNSVVNLLNNGTIAATNGADVTLNDVTSVLGALDLTVDGASTINIGTGIDAASVINAQFTSAGGTFNFLPGGLALLVTPPTVFGFGAGDHLDFGTSSTAGDKIVYTPNAGDTGGTLSLESGGGVAIGSVNLVGLYTLADFVLGADGIDFACFLRGTRLLTSRGEAPIETLRAGDLVATLESGFVPIKVVRTRTVSAATVMSDLAARPVCVAVGALGGGLPRRDLYVSPDHSLYLNGALVPARLLVNGRTITQPPRAAAAEYYHVELDPHEIIIAEGAASESYLDIGNQQFFGAPGVISLMSKVEPKNWEDACAPLLLAGPKLEEIRAKLNQEAENAALQRPVRRVA